VYLLVVCGCLQILAVSSYATPMPTWMKHLKPRKMRKMTDLLLYEKEKNTGMNTKM